MSDYQDFMDYIEKTKEASETSYIDAHTQWQQNTILGKLSLYLISFGKSPIIQLIIDGFTNQQDGGKSTSARLLSLFAFVALVTTVIVTVYALAAILQRIIGTEIVKEKEIVVYHTVHINDFLREEEEAEENKIQRVNAHQVRGKKEKRL